MIGSQVDIERVLDHIGDSIIVDGDEISLRSDRYRTFEKYGTTCQHCGKEADFFRKERHGQDEGWHMNLYARTPRGEVMFTKDHVIPKAQGGKDRIENYQTLCEDCNQDKGGIL